MLNVVRKYLNFEKVIVSDLTAKIFFNTIFISFLKLKLNKLLKFQIFNKKISYRITKN